MSNLNIYKVSGLPKVGASERLKFWTGGTSIIKNTRSYNYLLADINENLALISIGEGNSASLYNKIDLDVICLEALDRHTKNAELYPLDYIGAVIAQMYADGCFESDITDAEKRDSNLDMLVGLFEDRIKEPLQDKYSTIFMEWWTSEIVPNCYNANTPEQIARYDAIFNKPEKVGSKMDTDVALKNPQVYDSMADYITESGPCFLYMFIPADELTKYNSIIRWKSVKEKNVTFDFIKRNVGNMYDEESIKKMFRLGIIQYWGMTPERKLKQVYDAGGKIGDFGISEIIALITAIVSALSFLLSLIVTVYQITYNVAANAEEYIPNDDDYASMFGKGSKSNTTNYWLIGAAVVAALLFSN